MVEKIGAEIGRVYPVFEKLMNASKSFDKSVFIKVMLDDEFMTSLLKLILDPTIVTHIGRSFAELTPDQIDVDAYPFPDDGGIDDIIRIFKTTNGGADVKKLMLMIEAAVPYCAAKKFWVDIVSQQISLGVTAKTINKVAGHDIIPIFSVMLAEKFFSYPHYLSGRRFFLTEKLDGCRAFTTVEYRGEEEFPEVTIYSRSGHQYTNLPKVEYTLARLASDTKQSYFLDGELIVTDRDSMPSKEAFKKTSKILRTEGAKLGITYNIFDLLSDYEWEHKEGVRPYWCRREYLNGLSFCSDACQVVPVLYEGVDVDEVYKHLISQVALGHEGVMVNTAEGKYEFKRTKSLLKVKAMSDVDLKVIGMNRGVGKYQNTLGSMIVDYKGTEVGVGSGFSDAERDEIWLNHDAYIGKTATIQYFEETTDTSGKPNLRFPVFKGWRNPIDQ